MTVQSNETFEQIQLQPEKWGRHVESAIGAHLVNNARNEKYNLYYWRHRNDEVDFILERNRKLIAIEVKSGSIKNTAGMDAFKKTFNPSKLMLIGNTGLPWQQFLEINPVDLF